MLSFKELLATEQTLLFDGAMGTELYKRGIFINRCFEELNLSSPGLIEKVHRDYLNAGAQVLTVNSWAGNAVKLAQHNLQDKVAAINREAVRIAKDVAGDQAYVCGSLGPLGLRIEPFGPTSFDECAAYFREQASHLIEAGVDCISLETFADLTELGQAIRAVKELGDIPIIANFVIGMDGETPLRTPIEWIVAKLEEWQVSVLGLNCSVGPGPMLSCMEKIQKLTKLPLSVAPNAGLPKQVEGRQIYMCTPEYMAHFAKEFFRIGVRFVGGCCGTTPEHIRAMSNSVRYAQAMQSAAAVQVSVSEQEKAEQQKELRVPLREKSLWSQRIADKKLVTSVELLPPAGVNANQIIEKSLALKKAGVTAINIPDGPRASARMSAVLTAVMIEQGAGIETVLHYTCRDRNLLGMQSDMLGAQAIGLRNMLLITGDPPKLGDYPNMTGVFDVDAIGLTNMVHRLNGGRDLGGREISPPLTLSIGVGVNPVHADFNYEMKRFRWKVSAGAEWAITQPVFDIEALLRFLDYIDTQGLRIPIIAGIWPLLSYRNAIFMNNEVPGVVIPQSLIERMAKPTQAEDARKVGVDIAREMVTALQGRVEGFQVSAPFGRIDLALEVLQTVL